MKKAIFLLVCLLATACWTGYTQDEPKSEMKQSAKGVDMQKIHQELSASTFNACWTLIDKPVRSDEDTENMLLLAYASLWHWKQRSDCTPLEKSVGYWQISRCHALAGQHEMSHWFAEKCLQISTKNNLPPFYIGYAYESLARAALLKKDNSSAGNYLGKANEQLLLIQDDEEKKMLETDLKAMEIALKKPGD